MCYYAKHVTLQAYMQLGEFKKSRDYFLRARRLDPGNSEIRHELEQLDR